MPSSKTECSQCKKMFVNLNEHIKKSHTKSEIEICIMEGEEIPFYYEITKCIIFNKDYTHKIRQLHGISWNEYICVNEDNENKTDYNIVIHESTVIKKPSVIINKKDNPIYIKNLTIKYIDYS